MIYNSNFDAESARRVFCDPLPIPPPDLARRWKIAMSLFLPRRLAPHTVLLTALVAATPLAAQETEPKPVADPFLVVNIAGVERWQENVKYVFKAIERGDVFDKADGMLGRVNNLNGVDRSKPFGLMIYLNGLNPTLVGYLPVSNIDELQKTLSIGPLTAKRVEGKEDRYELTGGRRTLYVRFKNGFGFVADNSDVVEREFPDPAVVTRALSARYDLAIQMGLDAIPDASRNILLSLLRGNIEAQLQQRDNERPAEYRIRRASGMSNLQLLEQVLKHGRNVTIGWDVNPEKKLSVLEFALECRPDSELSSYLINIGSRPTQFRGVLSDRSPFAMSLSWALDKMRQKSLVEIITEGREAVAPSRPEEAEKSKIDSGVRDAAARLLDQALATAEQGHVDIFAQMSSVGEGRMAFTAGVRMTDADAVAGPLSDLLGSLGEKSPFKEIQREVETHRGVAIHRLIPKQINGPDRALYGEEMAIHIGAGQKAFWLAVGGREAVPALRKAMDVVSDSANAPPSEGSADPFRMVFNMEGWKDVGAQPDRTEPGRELMRKAFQPGSDSLRIDVRPTEHGARLRLEFDEGFLRWLALQIAQRYDRSQL